MSKAIRKKRGFRNPALVRKSSARSIPAPKTIRGSVQLEFASEADVARSVPLVSAIAGAWTYDAGTDDLLDPGSAPKIVILRTQIPRVP